MSNSINTNTGALTALSSLRGVTGLRDKVSKELQTGYRVAGFEDDAAVFAVAQGIRSRQKASYAVDSSLARGSAVLQAGLAGINKISDLLVSLKERAILALDGSLSDEQRRYIQDDAGSYIRQVTQAANAATIDRINLLSPEPVSAQTWLYAQTSLGPAPSAFGPRSGAQPTNADNEANDDIAPPSAGDQIYLGIPLQVGDQGLKPIRGQFNWSIKDSLGNVYDIGTQSFDLPSGLAADDVYYITPNGANTGGPAAFSWPALPAGANFAQVVVSGEYTYPADAPNPETIKITPRAVAEAAYGAVGNTAVTTSQAFGGGPFAQTISISGHQITNTTPPGKNDAITLSPLTVTIDPVGQPGYGSSPGQDITFDIVVDGTTVLTNQSFSYGPPFTYTLSGFDSFAAPSSAYTEIDYDDDHYTPAYSKASQKITFTNFRYAGVPTGNSVDVSNVSVNNTVWSYDSTLPKIFPDPLYTPLDTEGRYTVISRRDLTATGLSIGYVDLSSPHNAQRSLEWIQGAIDTVNAASGYFAARSRFVASQRDIVTELRDAAQTGLGALVDTDIAAAEAQSLSLEVREKLAVQSLNIANQSPSILLSLFRPL